MKGKWIIPVVLIVLLLAGGILWREMRPPALPFNRGPILRKCQALALATANVVHEHGRIVVVVPGTPEDHSLPGNGCWEAFREELKKHGGIRIAATEFIGRDEKGLPGCSLAGLLKICDQHADADAVVFFVGLPDWYPFSLSEHSKQFPKLVLMDVEMPASKLHYGGYFANGILAAMVGLPPELPPGMITRESTSQEFEVYTSENYEKMSD